MLVKAWAEIWLKTYVKPKVRSPGAAKQRNTLTQKSYDMYTQKIDGYIIPAIGKLKLRDIKDTHLQRILNSCADMSFSHVSKLRMIIKAMFSQALASRLIQYDPSINLSLPAAQKGKRRSLTAYERDILLKVAQTHRCGTWVKLMLYTGLRPSETAPLLVSDIDFEKKLIFVNKAIESGTKVVGSPKTSAGSRYVFIPDNFICELKAYAAEKNPDDFVFSQLDGKTMLTQTAISNNWRSFSRQMDLAMGAETTSHGHIYDPDDLDVNGNPLYPDKDGKPRNGHKIAPDLVMYCLRHTYCTDLQKQGVPLETAKYLMGHADITTTANIYSHPDIENALTAADIVSKNSSKNE